VAITCPKCHFGNPDDTAFCGKCGTPLPSGRRVTSDVKAEASGPRTETFQTPIKELTTGSTFAGRYQVIEELGHGGMGKVYKVFDTDIKEKIALKLLRPEIALDKETVERFSNELKLARKIRHKNICGMFDLGKAEGTTFITMEFVPGEDLKKLIRKMGQIGAGRAVSIAKQVCEGLSEAHHLGVVHRDLKPQNIMVDEDGNARIMDFGIARSLRGKGITGAGVMIGTPEYMSPEQVEGKDVDSRSDIYSLGIILYEMLTGRVPFEGDTPFTVGVKHKSEVPKDPRQLNAQIPPDLDRLILKCLEKDKAKRYQTADELHAELTRIEEEIPTTERMVPKRKLTKSTKVAAGEGDRKWKPIALLAGAVVVLAILVFLGLRIFSPHGEAIDSIAVLPFENVNADPNTDYLCDGITETIINKLSQLSSFKTVINRASVFTYKGKTVDPKKVGQELGVKAVLLTRLARVGDRLTISPTLVRTRDNSQLWGERYSRKFDDVFAIEEDMATNIIQALRLKLSGEQKQKISARPIDNAAAYEFYLKASREIDRFSEDACDRALQYLQSGHDLIGDNAVIYSAMAYVYWQYVNIGAKQEDFLAKAEEYVNKALAIDPYFPKAYVVQGLIGVFRGNLRESIRSLKKASSLDPNDPETLYWLANDYVQYVGKISAAVPLIDKFMQLDPLNPLVYALQGMGYYYNDRYDLALKFVSKAHQMDPGNVGTLWAYATLLAYNKETDEAFAVVDQMAKTYPNNVFTKLVLAMKYALLNDKVKLYQEMTPDFQKTCKRDAADSEYLALLLALVGAKEEALDWLENAVNRGFTNYPLLAEKDPWLANIRSEPRFKKLMERVKYEWEHFEE
jgi:serine/threonine protein kinase/tetratricopeptide (TPR) repeat protein